MAPPVPEAGCDAPAFVRHARGRRASRAGDQRDHRGVHGRLPEAAGIFPAGTVYAARDPHLLRWVHATLLDSFLLTYELYVGPLTPADKNGY
jgi:uncharacterized protein (DUF2236 family)